MIIGNHSEIQKGYYERFLENGNLEDTPTSQRYFNCIFEMSGCEEELEDLGNIIVDWQKKNAQGWSDLVGEKIDPHLTEKA